MEIFQREVRWLLGFAILCVTIPPRGQVALRRPKVQVFLDFYTFHSYFSSMKRKQQTTHNGPGMAHEIDFNDWSIDRLYIQSGPRKDYTFRNAKVSPLFKRE